MNDQQTKEWRQDRCGIPSASSYSKVLAKGQGVTRDNYKYEVLAERLSGKPRESFKSWQMQQGIEREALAAKLYSAVTGNKVVEVGFKKITLPDGSETGASLDRKIVGGGVLEIKSPELSAHLKVIDTKQVPSQYKAQTQGQLMVENEEWGDFVSFNPDMNPKNRIVIVRFYRDEAYIDNLKQEIMRFNQEVNQLIERYK